MSIIRWIVYAPISLAGGLLTVVFSPFAAYLSLGETTLPKWLRWMQTHDNQLDALWQQPNHMARYSILHGVHPEWCRQSPLLLWYCRMLWLIRNPAYGLANTLGYESGGNPGEVVAERGVWDSGETNWKITVWQGAWQIKAQIFYPKTKYFLRVYIGWKGVSGLSRFMLATHINPFRKYHSGR